MQHIGREFAWVDPLHVACGLRDRPDLLALIAGAGQAQRHGGRWSFIAVEADLHHTTDHAGDALFAPLREPDWQDGAVVGLVSYDAGARPATGHRAHVWPDLMMARYSGWLAFDHAAQTVRACGTTPEDAARAARWLDQAMVPTLSPAPAPAFEAEAPGTDYLAAVANVVARIGRGELFQANIARAWRGSLRDGADPFDVFLRLSGRGAAYGAYWRAGERAVVSNSPELFIRFEAATRRLEARPIKGTRPRHPDPARDAAAARDLLASAKDRAENLMIVDLMRNDLGRVAEIGTVAVEALWGLEHHPTVHHLTSVVAARARPDVDWADVLEATFPPGSITGAPKHQAMKVIAALEPPRGAWCGTLFARGFAEGGEAVASVLIRTAFFEREQGPWRWRTLAGAGITADSDPAAELEETAAKISALALALADRTVGAADRGDLTRAQVEAAAEGGDA